MKFLKSTYLPGFVFAWVEKSSCLKAEWNDKIVNCKMRSFLLSAISIWGRTKLNRSFSTNILQESLPVSHAHFLPHRLPERKEKQCKTIFNYIWSSERIWHILHNTQSIYWNHFDEKWEFAKAEEFRNAKFIIMLFISLKWLWLI